MVVGTSGAGSVDSLIPTAMNALIDTKFKVVPGYMSTNEIHIAIERGEVQGRCGMTWNFLSSVKADWLREGKVRLLSQFTARKNPDVPSGVPSVIDLVKTDDDRRLVRLIAAPNEVGQPFLAPPSTNPERANILRAAFAAALADPEMKADAVQAGIALDSMSGPELEAFISNVYETPKTVAKRAAEISRLK
jgi:tripartite-type tricarboxylate transporter receptor subunit TctC